MPATSYPDQGLRDNPTSTCNADLFRQSDIRLERLRRSIEHMTREARRQAAATDRTARNIERLNARIKSKTETNHG